ncbi:MAG: hypothetical protein Q4C49_05325 [Bacillota bacterium]|nr:hypothetical protein [Bacillota bacterium]
MIPDSIEEFKKLKYNNSSWWKKAKDMFRIVNQYECYTNEKIPNLLGKINPREIYKLHYDAFFNKKKFTSDAKTQGNIAIMSIDGNTYYAHSKVSKNEDKG